MRKQQRWRDLKRFERLFHITIPEVSIMRCNTLFSISQPINRQQIPVGRKAINGTANPLFFRGNCRIVLHFATCSCIISPLPKKWADVAQSVEHILGKDEVTRSNRVISSTSKPPRRKGLGVFICAFYHLCFDLCSNIAPTSFFLSIFGTVRVPIPWRGHGRGQKDRYEKLIIVIP